MKRFAQSITIIFSFILISAGVAPAADTVKCTECGMVCQIAAKFTSRIVQGEQILYFCDIGDLFTYLNRKKPPATRIEVKDYSTGEWIDAHKAYYVRSGKKFKTPMGWGIAAFIDKDKASTYGAPEDFDGLSKNVK